MVADFEVAARSHGWLGARPPVGLEAEMEPETTHEKLDPRLVATHKKMTQDGGVILLEELEPGN